MTTALQALLDCRHVNRSAVLRKLYDIHGPNIQLVEKEFKKLKLKCHPSLPRNVFVKLRKEKFFLEKTPPLIPPPAPPPAAATNDTLTLDLNKVKVIRADAMAQGGYLAAAEEYENLAKIARKLHELTALNNSV